MLNRIQSNLRARFCTHVQVGQCANKEAYAEAFAAGAGRSTPKTSSEQGRRMPTPRFYTAGAGGVATVETCVGAAWLRPSIPTSRRYIASKMNLPLYTYSRITSSFLLHSCRIVYDLLR
jgi:hypothetical protein